MCSFPLGTLSNLNSWNFVSPRILWSGNPYTLNRKNTSNMICCEDESVFACVCPLFFDGLLVCFVRWWVGMNYSWCLAVDSDSMALAPQHVVDLVSILGECAVYSETTVIVDVRSRLKTCLPGLFLREFSVWSVPFTKPQARFCWAMNSKMTPWRWRMFQEGWRMVFQFSWDV